MGDTPNMHAWPGEDQVAIALAARVVMLSAASKTCHLQSTTRQQDQLLGLVALATDTRMVRGESFPEFLVSAKDVLRKSADHHELAESEGETLDDIAACSPDDMLGKLFDRLVSLASQEYHRPLDPTLSRETLLGNPTDRPTAVRGKVKRRGNEVGLVLYVEPFDLTSLALIPRILAHEIVCHIAARDTGRWAEPPQPDVRDYFPDGFMDCAASLLLHRWLAIRDFPRVTPSGHLWVANLEYSCDKPEAFKAGIAAFSNCVSRTVAQASAPPDCTAERRAHIHVESENASIDAALRLNGDYGDICDKDRFVHDARGDVVADRFASVAAGGAEPSELFQEVASR